MRSAGLQWWAMFCIASMLLGSSTFAAEQPVTQKKSIPSENHSTASFGTVEPGRVIELIVKVDDENLYELVSVDELSPWTGGRENGVVRMSRAVPENGAAVHDKITGKYRRIGRTGETGKKGGESKLLDWSITATTASLDLIIDGLTEEQEQSPGAFIAVNGGIEEGNFVVKKDENGTDIKVPASDREPDAEAGHRAVPNDPQLVDGVVKLGGPGGGSWMLRFPAKVMVWLKDGDNRVAYTSGDPVPVGSIPADGLEIPFVVEGISSSDAAGDISITATYVLSGSSMGKLEDTVNATVWEVANVEWKTYADNTPLDVNTHPSTRDEDGNLTYEPGLRIFPGKKTPDDPKATQRRKVTIEATVKPSVAGRYVYFRMLDVDDASTNDRPIDPNHRLGSDNKYNDFRYKKEISYVLPEMSLSDVSTNARGVAVTTLSVSMQPGDNFRIAAATATNILDDLRDSGDGVGRVDVEGAPNFYVGAITELLTVWRKVHLELDTMAAVSGNRVTGISITRIIPPRAHLDFNLRTGLDDASPNLSDPKVKPNPQTEEPPPIKAGRFEDGTISIGVGNSARATPLLGNGNTFVEASDAFDVQFKIATNDGLKSQAGAIRLMRRVGDKTTFSVDTDTPLTNRAYADGVVEINGAKFKVSNNSQISFTVAGTVSLPVEYLADDDDESLLAKNPDGSSRKPDISLLDTALSWAYCEKGTELPGNEAPFVANVRVPKFHEIIKDHWNSAGSNSADFWIVHSMSAFQPGEYEDWGQRGFIGDYDSGFESSIRGAADGNAEHNGGSLIYLEVIRDGFILYPKDNRTEPMVVVHEIGHLLGNSGHEPVDKSGLYVERYLLNIRKSLKPVGGPKP